MPEVKGNMRIMILLIFSSSWRFRLSVFHFLYFYYTIDSGQTGVSLLKFYVIYKEQDKIW